MEKKELLISQYESLREKTDDKSFSILTFCQMFESDDLDLYNEFKNNQFDIDNVISIMSKRYNLDDTKSIAYKLIDNIYNNGYSYHIANSANYDSIMKNGLNNKDIKTEEQIDLEFLKSLLSEETFKKLLIFYKESKNNLFYSRVPRINVRYGYAPEWIKELETQKWMFDSIIEESKEAYVFILDILEKYKEKYKDTSRLLMLFPNKYTYPNQITHEEIDSLAAGDYKHAIGQVLFMIEHSINCSTSSNVMPDDIITFDCDTKEYIDNSEYRKNFTN